MNFKNILITLLVIVFSATSVLANSSDKSPLNEGAQFRSANLTAAGLTCAMCTKAINTELEQLSFIQSVKVDIKSSSFNIIFKKDVAPDFDQLKKAVEDAGFSVAKLKIFADFQNVAVKKDAHVSVGGKTFHFLNASAATLNGEKAFTVVDKDYVTAKEHKKYSTASTMACVKTGKAESCCTKEGIKPESRIYHVVI